VEYALKFVGCPYVYGGNSLTNGTDCSGFVKLVFGRYDVTLPRQSREQAQKGRKISSSELKPGDLVFYAKNGTVNHVALYIGDGKIVHAANSRQGIIISKYNYREVYCMRNVLD
jgi:NlpC/P60 family.